MVKVTLEFPNVEAAIAALGKLAGIGVTKMSGDVPPVVLVAQPVAKPPRKGRADRGQPRAPYGPRQPEAKGAEAGASPETAGSAPAPTAASAPAASTPQPSAPQAARPAPVEQTPPAVAEGPVPSAEETQEWFGKFYEKFQVTGAQALLAEYGVARLRELAPEKRAEFVRNVKMKLA